MDIVLYLTTIGAAKADDPSHIATIYKGHVVQDFGVRSERNHSHLVVLKPFINPHQRGFSIEFDRHEQGHAVFRLVCLILGWIEFDTHALL
ncbi:MAG: hypothetical protein Q8N33_09455 [Rhodocyclaceae bacterium]|nr:hypothetical protein [Rhodocyclaceae bacterium]